MHGPAALLTAGVRSASCGPAVRPSREPSCSEAEPGDRIFIDFELGGKNSGLTKINLIAGCRGQNTSTIQGFQNPEVRLQRPDLRFVVKDRHIIRSPSTQQARFSSQPINDGWQHVHGLREQWPGNPSVCLHLSDKIVSRPLRVSKNESRVQGDQGARTGTWALAKVACPAQIDLRFRREPAQAIGPSLPRQRRRFRKDCSPARLTAANHPATIFPEGTTSCRITLEHPPRQTRRPGIASTPFQITPDTDSVEQIPWGRSARQSTFYQPFYNPGPCFTAR